MNWFKKIFFLVWLCFGTFLSWSQTISLNGPWSFAIDPLGQGELIGWHKPWGQNSMRKNEDSSTFVAGMDVVNVPHTWSLDVRYQHIGKSWYRKSFKLPAAVKDKTVRLFFDGVFYKCRIFLNGELIAFHYGGYTPFSIDISQWVTFPELNFLSIEVDNSWDYLTIPGSRFGNRPNDQLYPWYDFGGITRDVRLQISSKIYVSNQKIEAQPDLNKGTAKITAITWLENKSARDTSVTLQTTITNRTTGKIVQTSSLLEKKVFLKAFSQQKTIAKISLDASDVLLWDFDNPNLYDVRSAIVSGKNEISDYETYFGIREFKADPSAPQLLLNGKPVRVAGANRHSDHPVYGSEDPEKLAVEDMGLLRNGNMIMSRLNHTPLSRHFYKWADEHGYLIFAEIPNWQISPVLMANQKLKDEFRSQMQEMVEAFWNSPSIVAYSTGNEYDNWSPEGDEWTRYQMEQYRQFDTTRLLTFVARGSAGSEQNLSTPHDSFRYCDFLNINNYASFPEMEKMLQLLHQKYPLKAIVLSEFGLRSDFVKSEQVRINHLDSVVAIIKRNPYVASCSYWSFNDYKSRFPNTNKNGYREWGIIDPERKPRGLYLAFQTLLSPVELSVKRNTIHIQSKADFPSYTISNHQLKLWEGGKLVQSYPLPELNPGSSYEVPVRKINGSTAITIENKQGFTIYDSRVVNQMSSQMDSVKK